MNSFSAKLHDLFFQRPSVRRKILTSYWTVIVAALPLWWYATSIERLSLPSSRVYAQARQPLRIPIHICLPVDASAIVSDVQDHLVGLPADVHVSAHLDCHLEPASYRIFTSTETFIIGRDLHISLDSISHLSTTLLALVAPDHNPLSHQHRVVQYSPRYRLAFSLLNEDAAAGGAILNWDIINAISRHINPVFNRLSILHNFTTESQVQYHAPLAFTPGILANGEYGLTSQDLTVFVNSAQWTLSSSVSNDPVLHFVIFVPSSERRPLKILNREGSPTDSTAFLLPQWGGIVIHNPTDCASTLTSPVLDSIFATFSTQLLALLGAPELPSALSLSHSVPGYVLSDWQLDALLRRRTFENAQGAQDTLQSIVTLVEKIENMPVGVGPKADVENALDALSKMKASSQTSLVDAFRYSADAFVLASRAFFNPNMLALLYFPAEHKWAVYTPLFASALIPIFVAALREGMAIKREWKEAKRAASKKTM